MTEACDYRTSTLQRYTTEMYTTCLIHGIGNFPRCDASLESSVQRGIKSEAQPHHLQGGASVNSVYTSWASRERDFPWGQWACLYRELTSEFIPRLFPFLPKGLKHKFTDVFRRSFLELHKLCIKKQQLAFHKIHSDKTTGTFLISTIYLLHLWPTWCACRGSSLPGSEFHQD